MIKGFGKYYYDYDKYYPVSEKKLKKMTTQIEKPTKMTSKRLTIGVYKLSNGMFIQKYYNYALRQRKWKLVKDLCFVHKNHKVIFESNFKKDCIKYCEIHHQ